MRVRGRVLTLAALLAFLFALPAAAPASAEAAPRVKSLPGADRANVAIRRTAHGIPHIVGSNFRNLAYGYGYAFAQDNICTIASSYVTVRAERSRFFGPDNTWKFEGNGSTVNNLNSDFFFKRIIDTGVVEKLLTQKPPSGPRAEIRSGVRGYVAGYNRYLRDTGVAKLSDPNCRGKEWVRPIREIDVYRYFFKLALLASSGVAIDGIGSAQPPTPPVPVGGATTTEKQMELIEGNLERFRFGDAGSNAYGLGSEATSDGHGMVLGNPHFPWQGSQRLYQSHLTVPGKADVAGASLFGVPIVLIGHTQRLAWSHTVSTARRFTPFELKLVPGSPTTYIYDGQPRQMTADKVTVQVPGAGGRLEDRTRTLYSSVHGPVFTSILGLPLFPWTSTTAHAMGDINAGNFRYLNHFFETNLAQSVREYDRVERRNQGIPWVNSIAADSKGEAYYADIGAVPNVPNSKAQACNTALGTQTTQLLGIPILDGSRTSCRWDNDPDAIQPGSFGPKNLPSMFRRDYVTNSNDSYWLSNPAQRLEGFARIIGDERAVRSLRTRLGLRIVQERLAGSDGLPGRRFTLRQLQDAVFNNRQYAGELFRDRLVSICKAEPVMQGSQGPIDVREACPILEQWNLRDDLDSRGAVLFRRFATKLLALPGPLGSVVSNPAAYEQPFDVNDPVNTPRGLSNNQGTRTAFADAVKELRDLGIPLNARLREYQYESRGNDRVPIHGGPGTLGVFNAITAPFAGKAGFPDVTTGSSFVMAAHLNGTRCPESRSILTYSQSANPESPYYADQTRMFSQKKWVDMRFCTEEVLRDRALRVTELGCVSDSGLRSARVRGARQGRVRFAFKRRFRVPVTVEVRRARAGRLGRRVLRVRRARSFTLKRRLSAGRYVARYTALGRTGKADRREVAFTVRRASGAQRVGASRRGFSRRERCGTLRSATLGSPVFGGRSGRPLRLRYKLRRRARVSVSLLRGKRVVRRLRPRARRAGTRRAAFRARGLPRGVYRVRLVVRAGGKRSGTVLAARRL
ncbi:MAG TPA: penicillin acylase family protein [Thermoleophilaceae bacterium]|nr:penicillin acylase family protein [Thermoleophilaceae bacterium]